MNAFKRLDSDMSLEAQVGPGPDFPALLSETLKVAGTDSCGALT